MAPAADERSLSSVSAQGLLTLAAMGSLTPSRHDSKNASLPNLPQAKASAKSPAPKSQQLDDSGQQAPPVQARRASRGSVQWSSAANSSVRSSFSNAAVLDPSTGQPIAWPGAFSPGQRYAGHTGFHAMALVPVATTENNYLGLCRGAWNLQNGDRKASFQKNKEAGAWSRSGSNKKTSTAFFLACKEPKCAFRSTFVSSDADLLWEKVFVYADRGIKLRWPFLAKSHVPQRVVLHNKYSFKCLFCVYLGRPDAMVFSGMENYLSHISVDHRGKPLGEVIEYKTQSIIDRIADDKEPFDINIWPTTANGEAMVSEWLSDKYLDPHYRPRQGTGDSSNDYFVSGALEPPREDSELDDQTSSVDQISDPSIALRADQLFKPQQHFRHVDPAANPLAPQPPPGDNPWSEYEHNPWAADDPGPRETRLEVSTQQHASLSERRRSSEQLVQSPVSIASSSVPSIPPRSHLRQHDQSSQMGQAQQAMEQLSLAHHVNNVSEDSLTACINEITAVFNEALIIVEDMKQQTARYLRAPPSALLEDSLLDATPEIEKQWQRGLSRFGPAFDVADPATIMSLQRVALKMHSDLLRPLRGAASDPNVIDFTYFEDTADTWHHKTISIMHELKERLAQSRQAPSPFSPAVSLPAPSPHPPPNFPPYSRGHSPRPEQDILQQRPLSDDSHSIPGSERHASTASTSSDPHTPVAAGVNPAEGRRRSSMMGFFRKKDSTDGREGLHGHRPSVSMRGAMKIDFKGKRREGSEDAVPRAFELDGDATELQRR